MKQTAPPRRILVLGTGTEIGKTHVVEALLGVQPPPEAVGLKPIESGFTPGDPSSDQLRLGSLRGAPYLFPRPIGPHLAAREAGITIDITTIDDWLTRESATATWVLVETAGGAFSPVGDALDNVGLARRLRPVRTLLVAPDRLGVLHDLRAATLALRAAAPGLPNPVLALSTPALSDASTGTNLREITRLLPRYACVVFPRAAPRDPASAGSATALWRALEAGPTG